jgi:hypothetical protein
MTQRQSDCASFQTMPSAAVPTYAGACSGSIRYADSFYCSDYASFLSLILEIS